MTFASRLLLFYLLLTGPVPVQAAAPSPMPEGDSACRTAPPVQIPFAPKPKSELLEQILKMDEPDMQMRGRLVIHALAPVQVELRLEYFQGDPQRIAALIALWTRSPALKDVRLPIHDLRLEGVVARLAGKSIEVQADKVIPPEGTLHNLNLRRTGDNRWELTVAEGNLQKIPEGIPDLPPLHDVRFSGLHATGSPQCPGRVQISSLAVEGIEARDATLEVLNITPGQEAWHGWLAQVTAPPLPGGPSILPDSLPFLVQETRGILRQLAQFAGLTPLPATEPLVIDHLVVQAARQGQQVNVTHLYLNTAGLQTQGRARLQPKPPTWILEPDLLLTNLQSPQKSMPKNFKKRLVLGQHRQ
ncbi:MAG: hypothetical protein H7833_10880 [Magnetococcus sp. DMHC-1]|nr:hypothetical protein [Magnetococcales bacterium]